MTKYLIVKCKELGDQFECDCDREPMFLVDDWKDWFQKNRPTYQFEVYKFVDDNEATLEKTYEEVMDEGMALYFWNMDDDHEEVAPTVIAHYKDYDRDYSKEHLDTFITENDFKNDLRSCGYVSWDDKEHKKYWVYGHYADGRYDLGY